MDDIKLRRRGRRITIVAGCKKDAKKIFDMLPEQMCAVVEQIEGLRKIGFQENQ